MQLLTDRSQAYVNHGRWIVDCARPHCANAELLTVGQQGVHCSNCDLMQSVEWPPDAERITTVLGRRPVPQTRNWAPAGHRQAASTGHSAGQTVDDLIDENQRFGVA